MKNKWKKDKFFRNKYANSEKKRNVVLYLLKTPVISSSIKVKLAKQLFNRYKKKQYSYIRARNRCLITGRSRSIIRLFKLSRLTFKKQASLGLLSGVKKFSW
jgi:small subunit ribosomal protein S14